MKHLFNSWKALAPKLAKRGLVLLLDYDGTLTPIVDKPEKSYLEASTRRTLKALAARPDCSVVIISGRTLTAIKKQVGLSGITYAGNHGLEIDGPRLQHKAVVPAPAAQTIAKIKGPLSALSKAHPGSLFENKGWTLSLHYRLCQPVVARALLHSARNTLGPFEKAGQVRVLSGKKVIEVFPPQVKGKGSAALWILQQERRRLSRNVMPVAVGDDTTDEDIFSVLRDPAVTVVVGRRPRSQARYYLKGPQEVRLLLERIAVLKNKSERIKDCGKKGCRVKRGNGKIISSPYNDKTITLKN